MKIKIDTINPIKAKIDNTIKTEVSQNYSNLYNKPSINGIELKENVTLEQLNLYSKNDTYNKNEIIQLLNEYGKIKLEVVNELPQVGQENTIYLLLKGRSNIYDEYVWVDNDYELIGNTGVDLSNYVTIEDLNEAIGGALEGEY